MPNVRKRIEMLERSLLPLQGLPGDNQSFERTLFGHCLGSCPGPVSRRAVMPLVVMSNQTLLRRRHLKPRPAPLGGAERTRVPRDKRRSVYW